MFVLQGEMGKSGEPGPEGEPGIKVPLYTKSLPFKYKTTHAMTCMI